MVGHKSQQLCLWPEPSGRCMVCWQAGQALSPALYMCCGRRARGQPPPEDGDPDADGGRGRRHGRPPHPAGRRHKPPRGVPLPRRQSAPNLAVSSNEGLGLCGSTLGQSAAVSAGRREVRHPEQRHDKSADASACPGMVQEVRCLLPCRLSVAPCGGPAPADYPTPFA